ncbi:MAG: hypothetical protein B7X12_08435 [Halothiobacillus sp. 20-53-49]|nr:MAG: hypothetical protein B7X12_08435 [Halothiobacillus sp. 20-53-49]
MESYNGTPHTLTRFDEDLNNLRSLMMNMGGMAEIGLSPQLMNWPSKSSRAIRPLLTIYAPSCRS